MPDWRIGRVLAAAVVMMVPFSAADAGDIYQTDGVAIHGYDPVAYFTDGKAVHGSARYVTDYKGVTFQFASAEHRDRFKTDPEHYAPQYGGFCAFAASQGYKATTEPQAFTIVDDKLYLNYSDFVSMKWNEGRQSYIESGDRNWPKVKVLDDP